MSDGNISPLELVSQDVNMEDSDLTIHVSLPEGKPVHLAEDLDMMRDELEKSGEFTRSKIRKIMGSLPEPSSPNDPLFQPTWTASPEVDIAFDMLYPRARYAFETPPLPPAKLPPIKRDLSRPDIRSQSPPRSDPNYLHGRRNAIIPPLSPELAHPSTTALGKVPATTPRPSALSKAPTKAKRPSTLSKVPATAPRPSTPKTSTSSPFMNLPGELKNRIYFYSLVKPDNLEVTARNWSTHQPALLKTCKQIRREALSIFYDENNLSANIHDWSPAVKNACHDLWARHEGLENAQFSHYFTGAPHWDNLLAWLKGFFLGTMRGICDVVNKPRALERKTVGVMFLMATIAKANNVPWEDLKLMLEAQRGLLAKGDGRWMPLG